MDYFLLNSKLCTFRYRLYALYAWGAPFLVVVITIMMQFIPDSYMISGIIRPLVGKHSCLFGGKLAHLLYLKLVAGERYRLWVRIPLNIRS